MADVPDIYVDQFSLALSAYAINLMFAKNPVRRR